MPPSGRRSRGGPRLDRRNAVKRFDYDAAAATASWSTSYSPASEAAADLRSSHYLDLSAASDRSLRIGGLGGSCDDVETLCRRLGLSGPEDFTIPVAAWNARRKLRFESAHEPAASPSAAMVNVRCDCAGPVSSGAEMKEKADDVPSTPPSNNFEVEVADDVPGTSSTSDVGKDALALLSSPRVINGIRGVCTPLLVPRVPPSPDLFLNSELDCVAAALPLPAVEGLLAPLLVGSLASLDITGSAWGIVQSFAPKEHGVCVFDELRKHSASEEEVGEVKSQRDGAQCERAQMEDRVLRVGEVAAHTSEGLTRTSPNEDKASSTATDTMLVVSSTGRFNNWLRGPPLGSGSFGTVYEAVTRDGMFFAIKEVSLLDQGSNAQQCIIQLEQEVALLSQFQHENIVQYYGTEKEESKLYIFLELVTQGSLASLYQKYNLRDSQVSAYTRQILNGLVYLHERNVVHRDLKCANILVHASGSVKLADFGVAKEMDKIKGLKSCRGSVYWMAPEVIHPRKSYGRAADIWSLGCTVLEMLTRQLPHPNRDWRTAFFMIGRGEQPPIPNYLSSDASDFISKCVRVHPDDRPSAVQLLDHPFVSRLSQSSSGSCCSTS